MSEPYKLTVVIKVESSKTQPGLNIQYADLELPAGSKDVRTWNEVIAFNPVKFMTPQQQKKS